MRWGNSMSVNFQIHSGLRQGGILSAHLFNVYVDDVINKLADSRLGCFIGNLSMNALMYADDLIILVISVQDLQSLVNLYVF